MLRRWAVCAAEGANRSCTGRPRAFSSTKRSWESFAPVLASSRESLPELVLPEESNALLDRSGFQQYFSPLSRHGWHLQVTPTRFRGAFSRTFEFPNFENMVSFIGKTRDAPTGHILIVPHLGRYPRAHLWLQSPEGVTQSLIRSVVEAEMDYRKFVSAGSVPEPRRFTKFTIQTFGQLEAEIAKMAKHHRLPLPYSPRPGRIEPVTLPPAPPMPASPPPLLAVADLETYIRPLINNGWRIKSLPNRAHTVQFNDFRCLARQYCFTDYSTARNFLYAAVAVMPPPVPGSLGGVHVELRSTRGVPEVILFSISELASDAPKKYGISLADVRFAIDLENEFHKNWVERADTTGVVFPSSVPTTVEEMLTYKFKLPPSGQKSP
ncbi:hypothetical protein DFH07DRAFT_967099 [Mycena maculata]|uniref:Uncharacterized protein n=1 Tax=Mycena maculata TaxID=230809 RepID=A0AAD7I783_9AGAR|nr:hypothetical protein DFH07DRAFT_967099 [Mycena maculata]